MLIILEKSLVIPKWASHFNENIELLSGQVLDWMKTRYGSTVLQSEAMNELKV